MKYVWAKMIAAFIVTALQVFLFFYVVKSIRVICDKDLVKHTDTCRLAWG